MADPEENDPRRRRKDPFDEFFRGLGFPSGEFERLFEEMQRALGRALSQGGAPFEPGKPYVHGFSFKIGPDGKPHIQEFGNRPRRDPAKKAVVLSEEREPPTDVIESAKEVAVTLEVPGIRKEDIDLRVTEETLEVNVDTEKRKYHKEVRLPAPVKPETTKATYNNGVLDVAIDKKSQDKPKPGVRVKVD